MFMYNLLLDESQSSEGQERKSVGLMAHAYLQICIPTVFFVHFFQIQSQYFFHIILRFLCHLLLVIIRNVQRYTRINKIYKSNYKIRNVGFFLRFS